MPELNETEPNQIGFDAKFASVLSLMTKPVREGLVSDSLRKFGNNYLQLMITGLCLAMRGNSSQVLELVNK